MNRQTINNYLSLVTSIEQQGTRTIYHLGDRFCVEVRKCCVNLKDKNNVMRLWKKAGYISEVLPSSRTQAGTAGAGTMSPKNVAPTENAG